MKGTNLEDSDNFRQHGCQAPCRVESWAVLWKRKQIAEGQFAQEKCRPRASTPLPLARAGRNSNKARHLGSAFSVQSTSDFMTLTSRKVRYGTCKTSAVRQTLTRVCCKQP